MDGLCFDLGKRRASSTLLVTKDQVGAGFIATVINFDSRNPYIDRDEGTLDVTSMGNKTYMHSGRIAANGHHKTHLHLSLRRSHSASSITLE